MSPMNPRLLRPLATGFNPRSISGLAVWHDAADSSTVTLDSGRVSAWADKSGNGRTMSNSTSGTTQPSYITAGQNGRNVVRFAAASIQRLNAAANSTFNFLHNGTPCTVMFAAKTGTTTDYNAVLTHFGSNNFSSSVGVYCGMDDRVGNARNNFIVPFISNGTGFPLNPGTAYNNFFTLNVYAVITVVFNTSNFTAAQRLGAAFNNGSLINDNAGTAAVSTANAASALQYGCGGNNGSPFDGDFCEMLMWTKLLSADERSAVRKYLYGKWGITP
jgi:hypothetical protein